MGWRGGGRTAGPRRITARRAGKCGECGKATAKGDRILWFPATRTALCEKCGDAAERRLAADDDDLLNNRCL